MLRNMRHKKQKRERLRKKEKFEKILVRYEQEKIG